MLRLILYHILSCVSGNAFYSNHEHRCHASTLFSHFRLPWPRSPIKVTRSRWTVSRALPSSWRTPPPRRKPSFATFWCASTCRAARAEAAPDARRRATAADCGRRSTCCWQTTAYTENVRTYMYVISLEYRQCSFTERWGSVVDISQLDQFMWTCSTVFDKHLTL